MCGGVLRSKKNPAIFPRKCHNFLINREKANHPSKKESGINVNQASLALISLTWRSSSRLSKTSTSNCERECGCGLGLLPNQISIFLFNSQFSLPSTTKLLHCFIFLSLCIYIYININIYLCLCVYLCFTFQVHESQSF